VSDFPIYVETETDASHGFTHRYEVNPSELENRELFRMSEQQVRLWLDQLEGGISPDSGLLVAAVPRELLKARPGKQLSGSVSTLSPFPSLIPETYQMAPSGQLHVDQALVQKVPRFLAVQLPEGPCTAEVWDHEQKVVWSHLFVAQPRIINVVGP
jgi:hypothetical protein